MTKDCVQDDSAVVQALVFFFQTDLLPYVELPRQCVYALRPPQGPLVEIPDALSVAALLRLIIVLRGELHA